MTPYLDQFIDRGRRPAALVHQLTSRRPALGLLLIPMLLVPGNVVTWATTGEARPLLVLGILALTVLVLGTVWIGILGFFGPLRHLPFGQRMAVRAAVRTGDAIADPALAPAVIAETDLVLRRRSRRSQHLGSSRWLAGLLFLSPILGAGSSPPGETVGGLMNAAVGAWAFACFLPVATDRSIAAAEHARATAVLLVGDGV